MNLAEGVLKAAGDGTVFVAGDLSIHVAKDFAAHIGREVVCGIRPSDIQLAAPDQLGASTAQINLIEATGTETMVKMTVNGHALQGVFKDRLTALLGDTITVDLSQGAQHLFDKGTGARI